MSRRKKVYGRRRKIRVIPVLIIVILVLAVVSLAFKLFRKETYASKVDEVMSSDVLKISGMVSTISSVDTNVYTKGKIKYTNQHEGIVKLSTFDGTLSEDKEKAEKARTLLASLKDLKEEDTVSTLPKKDNGYYWVDVSVTTEDDFLVFSGEDEYNFDMYYDMEGQKVYVKEKYYDEFSSKNNKVKFTGYKSNDKLKGLIEELAGKKSAQ